jgi:choice-of-anchor C domain-containing protein
MTIKTPAITNQLEIGKPIRRHQWSIELTPEKLAASLSLTLLALASGLLLGGEAAQGANLLRNGSFEIGRNPGRHFSRLYPGSTAINGWTVTRGSIDYIGGYWQAADGNRSIDLDGRDAGEIAQTFSTTVGQSYLVTFALAGNRENLPLLKEMRVAAAGQSADFSFDITGKSFSDMGWLLKSWQFTAVDTETTLKFLSLSKRNPQTYGAALDNVSVVAISQPVAVPEPSSVAGLIAVSALGACLMRKRGGNKLVS